MAVSQVISTNDTYAQESAVVDQAEENNNTDTETTPIHASEIVGLSALIEKTVRDRQSRPESTPGLDQYVKSIVRRCRVSGSVKGDRITATNISC